VPMERCLVGYPPRWDLFCRHGGVFTSTRLFVCAFAPVVGIAHMGCPVSFSARVVAPAVTTSPSSSSLQHSTTYPSRSSLSLARFDDGETVMIESLYWWGFTIVYALVHCSRRLASIDSERGRARERKQTLMVQL
jgi:uncharacterized membrane protein YagU involved in acid resistance